MISHVRVARAPLGQAIAIRAKIDDESEVFAPSVNVRPQGKQGYDAIEMHKRGDVYEATIPAEQVTQSLEYFIEAFDEHGNGPAREGTPESPIPVIAFDPATPPPPPPPGPELVEKDPPPRASGGGGGIERKWWFWTIVGAALAGGAVAVYFVARPPGAVESVDVHVQGPDPTAGL